MSGQALNAGRHVLALLPQAVAMLPEGERDADGRLMQGKPGGRDVQLVHLYLCDRHDDVTELAGETVGQVAATLAMSKATAQRCLDVLHDLGVWRRGTRGGPGSPTRRSATFCGADFDPGTWLHLVETSSLETEAGTGLHQVETSQATNWSPPSAYSSPPSAYSSPPRSNWSPPGGDTPPTTNHATTTHARELDDHTDCVEPFCDRRNGLCNEIDPQTLESVRGVWRCPGPTLADEGAA